ncbi:MAG: DnaJ C-terminal domain-containing protein [Pseudomonadota bacterium]
MDPYEALGVSKTASAEEIKKAYRKIVKENHPDLNPGDKAGEERFKAASAAHDLLKDPEKRARFDRGEIDMHGQERPDAHYYRTYAGAQDNPYRGDQQFDDYEDLSGIFNEFMRSKQGARGTSGSHHGPGFHANGADTRYRLEVAFMDAALGGSTRLTMPDGSALEVQIPRGIADGQTIRLRGKGGEPIGKGRAGDALITISIAPHKIFSREGDVVRVTLPVTIYEAVLGGKVEVPTITGPVSLSIPGGSSSGQVLRLRERGIAPRGREKRGDQLVELKIVTPKSVDDELAVVMEKWRDEHAYNPREGMAS